VVPSDNLVRQIDGLLDLSWVHKELAPYYSHTGRPSIDLPLASPRQNRTMRAALQLDYQTGTKHFYPIDTRA
jgi:hypothetical protein